MEINFLIISNSTFEVFKKLVERSFVVNKILVKISYRDYNSILTEQKIKGLKNIDVALIYCNNEELKTYTTFQDKLRYQNKDVEITMQYINRIIDKLKDFQISKIFLSNFCEFTNSELGNFTRLYPQNKIKFIHKLNDNVDNIVKKKKIYLLDNNNLSIKFGLNK